MPSRRAWIAGVILGAASLAINARAPRVKLAVTRGRPALDAAIPRRFGDWREDTSVPQVSSTSGDDDVAAQVYSQVVSRTYVNSARQWVMFLVAYGEDQADATTQVHLPESCYVAQGFDVEPTRQDAIARPPGGAIPVVRMMTRRGSRIEPVTYWTTVDHLALNNEPARKLARARYALAGKIPDGMLVRISSLDTDPRTAYALQDQFVRDLSGVVAPGPRELIFGASNA